MLNVFENRRIVVAVQQEISDYEALMEKEDECVRWQLQTTAAHNEFCHSLHLGEVIFKGVMTTFKWRKSVSGKQQEGLVRRGRFT
jgi:hypothetical protein